ncbi:MAG TPA: CoA pyrophosphatase [Acidimicrobiia bacterium]
MQGPAGPSRADEPRGGKQRIPRPADWQPADPTPWHVREEPVPKLSLADVRGRLADLPPPRPAPEAPADLVGSPRPSAVLLALFEADGEARIILTKRPETMPTHQGEIAFPGGKLDPLVDTDLRATALREAEEEIGLEPGLVEIVAELDGIGTLASRFVIAPFVGLLASRPVLTPDPREVVRVFDVPLSELLAPGVHHAEHWPTPSSAMELHFFDLADETVWGATARILYGFLHHLTRAIT